MEYELGHYYEFIGNVQDDLSLRVLGSTDFGTNIGMLSRIILYYNCANMA